MQPKQKLKYVGVKALCLLAGCGMMQPVAAAEAVGEITHLRGVLSALHQDGSQALLSIKSGVSEGDVLTTAESTYARIRFKDQSEVILRPSTQFKVEKLTFDEQKPAQDQMVLELIKGGLRKVSGMIGKRSQAHDELKTPVATIGIRGTHYGALYCRKELGGCEQIPTLTGAQLADGLYVDVAKGEIALNNQAGQVAVREGQFSYVQNNNVLPVLVSPEQGVRVTVPPAILKNNSRGSGIDKDNSEGACSIQ